MPSYLVMPIGIPIIVVTRIPINIPPLTSSITSVEVISRPMRASRALPWVMSPSFIRVALSSITIPDFCKPTKAMNKPIPMVRACCMDLGMELTIASRKLVIVRSIIIRPSTNTAVRARRQSTPSPRHIANTKKVLDPIPGATPKGSFATIAISREPRTAISAVVVNTAPRGIPSRDANSCGLTASMYDIVRKEVIPANTSVRTLFCAGSNPKSLFSISFS